MCEVTSGDNRLRRRLTSPCLQSTDGNTAKLTCSVVMSRFDYCDTVFFGAFSTTVDILQLTQKQPARSRLSSVRLATAASVAPLAAIETANPPQDVTANTQFYPHRRRHIWWNNFKELFQQYIFVGRQLQSSEHGQNWPGSRCILRVRLYLELIVGKRPPVSGWTEMQGWTMTDEIAGVDMHDWTMTDLSFAFEFRKF